MYCYKKCILVEVGGKIVMSTDFPVSAEELIIEIPKHYNFIEPIKCELFRAGLNDVYKTEIENKTYFLRISRLGIYEYRDYEDETAIIDFLHDNNIDVAAPVRCNDGNFVWTIEKPSGTGYCVLFHEAKNEPSGDELIKSYNLGKTVACMHVTADKKDFIINRKPIDLIQLIQNPLELIKPHFLDRTDEYNYICEAMNEMRDFIQKTLKTEKPYYGFCHGDIQPSNYYYIGEQPVFFDFDCMGNGWRSHDIGVLALNNTFVYLATKQNINYIESDEWKEFIKGYNSIRKLDADEINAVNIFAAIRIVWVWGVHADLIKRGTPSPLFEDNYFKYFYNVFKYWYERALKIIKD